MEPAAAPRGLGAAFAQILDSARNASPVERDAAGIDMKAEIRNSSHLHPRETTRRLADKVLELTGSALQDDATMLVLDWHDHHGRDRDTVAGAGPTPHEG